MMKRPTNLVTTAVIALAVGLLAPVLAVGDAGAQDTSQLGCATVLSPETRALMIQRTLERSNIPIDAPDGPYCVPIAIHVIGDDAGNGYISQAQLDQGLIDINTHELYVNTGMSFYYLPDIDYIDSDTYFSIDSDAEGDALRGLNRVANAINVYFVPEYPDACGRASFPGDAVQGVLMNNGCTGLADNISTYPHELGHYFNLLHTHETSTGVELVDGSNCDSAGDLLCDTPADPNLSRQVDASCVYTGSDTDPNGDSYNPDTSQLMSYSAKNCRVNVTPQGEARALLALLLDRPNLLNCPPVADCGGPYVAECTSCTTTPVMLDGTASYDPEGEPLTYMWSGAPFDDPTSATPTGQFPLGDTEVTLVVSDGMGETECTVTVTVEDTTPPDLACPADITVECSTTGGVPADELVDFLADYVVSDVCDCDPVVENDAPSFFMGPCSGNNGVTTVTWTATDESGNQSTCSADVTVEDTTPPQFDTLTLSRDVLWPPNHKMSEITVTIEVSDICDDDPVVTLESITSDEPDNGQGDGNTVDDIQEADYGTDDRTFLLRSERSGKGDGRVYTITYQVTDCSGNATQASVEVHVPHNQGAMAMAYSGFLADGTAMQPAADLLRIVIASTGDPDVDPGDPRSGRLNREGYFVRQLLPDKILLGNAWGVAAPVAQNFVDADRDGREDLVLTFAASDVLDLLPTVAEYGALGVQFRNAPAGGHRWVPDVFELGAPLVVPLDLEPVDKADAIPRDLPLAVSPNPFNPQTVLAFGLERAGHVRIRVFNLRGQLVREIVDQDLGAGRHEFVWDGNDRTGGRTASGFYIVRLERPDRVEMQKVMLLK